MHIILLRVRISVRFYCVLAVRAWVRLEFGFFGLVPPAFTAIHFNASCVLRVVRERALHYNIVYLCESARCLSKMFSVEFSRVRDAYLDANRSSGFINLRALALLRYQRSRTALDTQVG